MWIFLSGGLLMPARIPNGGSEGTADPKFTNNGEFTLQVRGRVDSHLQNFIRDYMDPMKLRHSGIQYTPQLDYNVRFYTTPQAFASAIARATLDIDYLKFKPTAERKNAHGKPFYKDGVEYHSVLNSIWGTVCHLGAPGGMWGAYSSLNPKGYRKAKHTARTYSRNLPLGATFGSRSDESGLWQQSSDMDYTPDRDEHVADLISQMSGVPIDQWEDYLTREDFELLTPYIEEERFIESRREARRSKRVAKKSSRRYRRTSSKN